MILPESFLEQIKMSLGDDFSLFISALHSEVPQSIRINKNKYRSVFDQNEKIPWCDLGRYLPKRPIYTLDPAFHAGAYYVQEASSMFLAQVISELQLNSQPLKILDLCAAPGGKTTLLHDYLHPDSIIVANEVVKNRALILKENCIKWGSKNIIITSCDPSLFSEVGLTFDIIFVDAPCSGEGMFRKDPDSISEWSSESVIHCSLRQRRILEDILPCLKKDGYLIYSTCTYNDRENIDNVDWICQQHHLSCLSMTFVDAYGVKTIEKNNAIGYQCYPHHLRGEGFFFSILKNNNVSSISAKSYIESNLRHLTSKETSPLVAFVDAHYLGDVYLNPSGDCYYLLPELRQWIATAQTRMNVQYAGIKLGTLNKNVFTPDHALALSNICNQDIFSMPLEYEQALSYLRRNLNFIESKEKGWQLASFESLNLGWYKQLGNRINNYYPIDWRIRM